MTNVGRSLKTWLPSWTGVCGSVELGAHGARLRGHVQASGKSSGFACARCTALFTALVSGQGGRASRVSVSKRLARFLASAGSNGRRGIRLDSMPANVVSFAGAASDEAAPMVASGSQPPMGASCGDLPERTQLLTVRGTAPCAASAAKARAIAGG